jgi:nitroreductase/NAD-dependent dihydropyrimidine dehydrogenase PreA subunit
MRFTVDESKCTLCGACLKTCPTDMVREKRGAIKISFVACIGCGHCLAICPNGAVSCEDIGYEGGFEVPDEVAATPAQLLGLIKQRRTVRRYLPEPVSHEQLELVLQAARYVPTGANAQPQQFLILTDDAAKANLRDAIMDYYRGYGEVMADKEHPERLAAYGNAGMGEMHEHVLAAVPSFVKNVETGRDRLFFEAPAVIIIHAPKNEVTPREACDYAAFAITLMAHAQGLGTCITAYASMALQALPELARETGIPEGNEVYAVVVIGHPAEEYQMVPPRKPAQVEWV